jgi:hypothetical protein
LAIHRLLQNSAFEPEDISRLTTAYERALKQLRLEDRNDPLTETIARHIIEAAQNGEKDPERICALALQQLDTPPHK